jgi:hypothetical protein
MPLGIVNVPIVINQGSEVTTVFSSIFPTFEFHAKRSFSLVLWDVS